MGENDEADAGATSAADAGATKRAESEARLTSWVRKTTDKVPTGWLITGAGAILLGATAAFGGLQTVPEAGPVELAPGEHFIGADIDMSVVAVELSDTRQTAGVVPDEGQRVLVVIIDATNLFDRARPVFGGNDTAAAVDSIRVEGLDETPKISRVDDGDGATWLQPDVPARLMVSWAVEPGDFADGDEVTVTLPDGEHTVGSFVTSEEYWSDVHVGARVLTSIEEVPAS
ncbi:MULTISPECIES: hypothetical protein [unclassified Microbacterium]|uniref:hypothetical protein n=1 Tax=unclassified Microbacterium TaxID=2609290 RepID=UPI0012FACE4C|nr:hypothetical protein [Microbacterium sp. MAH-37]MVQ43496.1 hypothetical protein [Microbacterium sp. MAH-37]